MDFPRVRVGLAGGHDNVANNLVARQSSIGCTSLYQEPKAGVAVDATKNVVFKWDTSCKIDSPKIDLYLYMTGGKLVQVNKGIDFTTGQFAAQLNAGWWNYTESSQMYTNILKNGGMSWDTSWPTGPTFTVEYKAAPPYTVSTSNGVPVTIFTSSVPTGGVVQSVDQAGKAGTSKAVIAVAVVIPIVVLCILGAIAFYFYRMREKQKLKRWSHALSQASSMEWEKGARPGERTSSYGRPSSAYSRTGGRPSTHYTRASANYSRPSMSSINRPTSSVVMDNLAGAGAGQRAMFPGAGEYQEGPVRSSVVLPDGTTRQSRISFADTQRPRVSFSNDTRPHVSSGLAPPSPAAVAYATGSAVDDRDGNDSPTKDGRAALRTRSSADELRDMEAVMLMRHSGVHPQPIDEDHVEALDGASKPTSPTPGSGPTPTVAYGPDQMLAVYAARGQVNASPVNTPPVQAPPAAAKPAPSAGKMRRFLSRRESSRKEVPQYRPETPSRAVASPSPEPMSMRSYVHLNNGTASAHVIDSLPPPGPPRSASRQSDNSRYDDAYDGDQR